MIAKIAGFDSSFNPDAKPVSARNPSLNRIRQLDGTMAISSAHGFGQFIDGTWHEVVRRHGEKYGVENASQMTREQTNAPEIRSNRTLQAGMLAEFTKENIEKGKRLGGPDVDANVYAFHNLGDRDATTFLNALKSNPSQRVDSVLSRKVIAGNPSLYGDGSQSVAQSYDVMGRHMQRYERYALETVDVARDNTIGRIQQNLNSLGITDARGEPLVVDGLRGDPGSRTNEAIAAFQRQTSLPGDLPGQQTPAGVLAATEIALDARDPIRRIQRMIEDIDQRFGNGAPNRAQPAAAQSGNALPDLLVRARGMEAATAAAPATPMPPQATRTPSAQQHEPAAPSSAAAAKTLPLLPTADLQPGDRGRNVATLQEQLRALGATDRDGQPLKVDSHYGQRTKDAVEQFQLWSGREINGIADKDTLQALAAQSRFAALQREQGNAPGLHLADNLQPAMTNPAAAGHDKSSRCRQSTRSANTGYSTTTNATCIRKPARERHQAGVSQGHRHRRRACDLHRTPRGQRDGRAGHGSAATDRAKPAAGREPRSGAAGAGGATSAVRTPAIEHACDAALTAYVRACTSAGTPPQLRV
ncbi:peptidoglycan-binding domain-containing protein [Luteimonas aestuarii]|uniref:peptidoglycan-binding domain-containing protein n=1 Tax=Luteimonas aestuarii TaxID=453837 RepID=UPI0014047B6C|nr:peptidoglycan-binding domain-containing protein [Luteimonas aestuarii]